MINTNPPLLLSFKIARFHKDLAILFIFCLHAHTLWGILWVMMKKEKTVSIHVAVAATVFGRETVCYADYSRTCPVQDDTEYDIMPIEWIEANCEMDSIRWEDDPEDQSLVLNEISLVEAKALCRAFSFDVDWSEV